jgi:hypothetical protein
MLILDQTLADTSTVGRQSVTDPIGKTPELLGENLKLRVVRFERNRRISPVPVRPGEGPLTEPFVPSLLQLQFHSALLFTASFHVPPFSFSRRLDRHRLHEHLPRGAHLLRRQFRRPAALRPRARADARPAIGCSRITSRSFSASTADMWNSRRTDPAVFSLVQGERGKPDICFDRTSFQIG